MKILKNILTLVILRKLHVSLSDAWFRTFTMDNSFEIVHLHYESVLALILQFNHV